MKINEEKYDQEWAKWESIMGTAKGCLEAAGDLSSAIMQDGELVELSSEKIQIAIDELQAAKQLVEKLEFVEFIEE
ncbi:hypothetical protein [Enterococcus sp. HY326]|uniref:hypothetical protein n=1 Tax=Enterococcus sp. HY326 TaxID=2971265 RepID=UPI0022408AC1|nr:hypothetical protein [Enterococcus sp. HY326]